MNYWDLILKKPGTIWTKLHDNKDWSGSNVAWCGYKTGDSNVRSRCVEAIRTKCGSEISSSVYKLDVSNKDIICEQNRAVCIQM